MNGLNNKNKIIKLCSWNVAGLRSCIRKGAFADYLKKSNPDILCLSETKCRREEIGLDLSNYKTIWNDCSQKKGYAGVGIFSKFEPLKTDLTPLGPNISDGRIIVLEFDNFFLINTYVPNAGMMLRFMQRRHEWNDAMKKLIIYLNTIKPLIWTGDLNVAYLDFDVYDGRTNKNRVNSAGFTDYERNDFTEYITQLNFVDVYRQFYPSVEEDAMTFWSYRSNNRKLKRGWRLDYFIVSERIKNIAKSVKVASDQMGSDHAPIEMEISAPWPMKQFVKETNGDQAVKKTPIQKRISDFITNQPKKPKLENWNLLTQIDFNNDWKTFLAKQFKKGYFKGIVKRLVDTSKTTQIYPPVGSVFNAFKFTSFDEIKVVILGQDPYHEEGEAHGLCFSVPLNKKSPPSLNNIFKELKDDLKCPFPSSGSLQKWAEQGVFLLNSILTVTSQKAKSHKDFGWDTFTEAVLKHINENKKGVVFVLWGDEAQSRGKIVDRKKHLVLESSHPSPLSSYRGFFGSKPFSRINSYLKENGKSEINWI